MDLPDKWAHVDLLALLVCLDLKDMLDLLDLPVTMALKVHLALKVKLVLPEKTEKTVLPALTVNPVKLDNLDHKAHVVSLALLVFPELKDTEVSLVNLEKTEKQAVTETLVLKVPWETAVPLVLLDLPVNKAHVVILENLVMLVLVELTVCRANLDLPAQWELLDPLDSLEALDQREKPVLSVIKVLKDLKVLVEKTDDQAHLVQLVFLEPLVWMVAMARKELLAMLVHLVHLAFLAQEVHPDPKETWVPQA